MTIACVDFLKDFSFPENAAWDPIKSLSGSPSSNDNFHALQNLMEMHHFPAQTSGLSNIDIEMPFSGLNPCRKTNMSLKRDNFNRKYIFQPLIFKWYSLVFGGVLKKIGFEALMSLVVDWKMLKGMNAWTNFSEFAWALQNTPWKLN